MKLLLQRTPRSRSSFFTLYLFRSPNRDLWGIIRHNQSDNRWFFHHLTGMLRTMQKVMDYLGFPQSGQLIRSWEGKCPPVEEVDLMANYAGAQVREEEQDAQATFMVHIQYRQNASWQGTVQWLEGKRTQNFRSALELILLLDEALPNSEDSEDGAADNGASPSV